MWIDVLSKGIGALLGFESQHLDRGSSVLTTIPRPFHEKEEEEDTKKKQGEEETQCHNYSFFSKYDNIYA